VAYARDAMDGLELAKRIVADTPGLVKELAEARAKSAGEVTRPEHAPSTSTTRSKLVPDPERGAAAARSRPARPPQHAAGARVAVREPADAVRPPPGPQGQLAAEAGHAGPEGSPGARGWPQGAGGVGGRAGGQARLSRGAGGAGHASASSAPRATATPCTCSHRTAARCWSRWCSRGSRAPTACVSRTMSAPRAACPITSRCSTRRAAWAYARCRRS
jgi:hypothetical protein